MGAEPTLVNVLGPLEVVHADAVLALSARKHRQLLVALLLTRTARSGALLVEDLWGESPPASADKLVQQYVSQLRRLLPDSMTLQTVETGYTLALDGAVVDAVRFEESVIAGRDALRAGDPALAWSLLRRGLDLWRGRAYEEFADLEFVLPEAVRLEGLRRDAVEDAFDAGLALGRHVDLLPELRREAAANPLRERLQGQAVLALHRSGQQAEALELYRGVRERLVDELGMEPCSDLQQLHRRVLQQDPSLLVVTPPVVGNLPTPAHALRGRQTELAECGALLRREGVRLVVLTGAGGSGKTRLALELARTMAPDLAHGAVFVNLAPLRDPEQLVGTLCVELGVAPQASDALEALAAALRTREVLLVLDNFEQVRAAGPVLVALLERTAHVRLLVTSRVVLHLSGEHVYPVDPLTPEAAAALFVERAREADAAFTPLADDADVIRRLCHRLDELPLAIELVAGTVRALTPTELLQRIEDRLPMLAGKPRDLPARQHTILATLEWSYEQLPEAARCTLARLSVFSGGFSAAAALQVCDVDADDLALLVDHNLLIRTVVLGASRYSMLQTVGDFAARQLSEPSDGTSWRRRHADHMLDLAGSFALSVESLGTGRPQRHAAARIDYANMQAALDWAEAHDPELGLRIALALEQLWITTNPREGVRRISRLLDVADSAPVLLRAQGLRDLGGSTEVSGDWELAARHYQRSLELYEELGDVAGVIELWFRLANCQLYGGDVVQARSLVDNALAAARRHDLRMLEASLLGSLSLIEYLEGDATKAYETLVESLRVTRVSGGWVWAEAVLLGNLADVASEINLLDEAEHHGRESLRRGRELGDRITIVFALAVLAVTAAARDDRMRAGHLWGSVEAEEGRSLLGRWAHERDRLFARLGGHDDDAEFEAGRLAGRATSLGHAMAYALDEA